MTARAPEGPILPLLIGGVSDGERLVVRPGETEHVVLRQGRAPHVYRLRTFKLSDPASSRSGISWPAVRVWVHEDTDPRAAARRLLETLLGEWSE